MSTCSSARYHKTTGLTVIAITQLCNGLTADGCEGMAAPHNGTPNAGAQSCEGPGASPLARLLRGQMTRLAGIAYYADRRGAVVVGSGILFSETVAVEGAS